MGWTQSASFSPAACLVHSHLISKVPKAEGLSHIVGNAVLFQKSLLAGLWELVCDCQRASSVCVQLLERETVVTI